MGTPRSREEAKGTEYEDLWQTPPHWPDGVHYLPLNGFKNLGLDGRNRLYWDGVPIVTKDTVSLEGWTLFLAAVATVATVVAAAWPIVVHLKWFGSWHYCFWPPAPKSAASSTLPASAGQEAYRQPLGLDLILEPEERDILIRTSLPTL